LFVARLTPRLKLRRILVIIILSGVTAGAFALRQLGTYLAKEDPLQKGDAIAVLAGTRMDRPLEALDLYRQGYAPRIVLTYDTRERSLDVLPARGVVIPRDADVARDTLIHLGVPATAIIQPPRIHDNTAEEAQTLRSLARGHGWKRLIVVTSHYHLRRAAFAFRRELQGSGIEVEMRATRYEPVNPDRWWSTRQDLRWVLDESAKLIAYELGLGA